MYTIDSYTNKSSITNRCSCITMIKDCINTMVNASMVLQKKSTNVLCNSKVKECGVYFKTGLCRLPDELCTAYNCMLIIHNVNKIT